MNLCPDWVASILDYEFPSCGSHDSHADSARDTAATCGHSVQRSATTEKRSAENLSHNKFAKRGRFDNIRQPARPTHYKWDEEDKAIFDPLMRKRFDQVIQCILPQEQFQTWMKNIVENYNGGRVRCLKISSHFTGTGLITSAMQEPAHT